MIWGLVVCLGFSGAAYLINSSYTAWQESPVATSITTHPISDLDFPTVTVCPPKGSNTALNYDLMKADNKSLTKDDRNTLEKQSVELFLVPSHKDYIERMISMANTENMKKMYEGHQSIPKASGRKGFDIFKWENSGSFETPGFKEEFNPNHFIDDKNYHMILQFPANIQEHVGSGSLVVLLEVDTRGEDEGWQELVQYQERAKLKLSEPGVYKTWEEAEAHCQAEGGHLASVLSEEETTEAIDPAI